jgi:protein-S-isoprenylcysteine O-methyltransferase Ste14
MIQWIVLIILTAILAVISRASLTAPNSHGFYRFFAWVAILALFILNVPFWFRNPFCITQIISWFLLVGSLFPAVWGAVLLHRAGTSNCKREDTTLFKFEKTCSLVTTGIYKYIRHPLYGSLLFLAAGIFIKHPTWFGSLLLLSAVIFLHQTAKKDEFECIGYFGPEYRAYMQRTKMFIPFLF